MKITDKVGIIDMNNILDTIMPNGKPLRDCTKEEVEAAAKYFADLEAGKIQQHRRD
jgi:hypothetical protein